MLASLRRLYRRLRYGEPIVVVSGLPRSGTSMIMKMLEAGGLPVLTDGLRAADEDNPKGYYEVERVKGLAEETDKGWLAEARGKGIKVISYLLKSLPPQFNYRVVFIRREIEEVLASQRKMLARRGETEETPPERMRALFEDDLWRASYQLKHGRSSRRSSSTTRPSSPGRSRRRGASPRSSAAGWTSRPWPRSSTRSSTATARAEPRS